MEEESEPGNMDASYLEKQDIPHPWPRMIHGECIARQLKNNKLLDLKNSLSNLKKKNKQKKQQLNNP